MTFCSLDVSRKARHGSSFCRLDAAGAGIKKPKLLQKQRLSKITMEFAMGDVVM